MAETNVELIESGHRSLMNVYGCQPIVFERGEGPYLYDVEGKRYLDLFCGIAVTSLGHAHPRVTAAVERQIRAVTHVSNVFHVRSTLELARRLSVRFKSAKVFFSNSGAEANEAAIKIARKWGSQHGGRFEIITTLGSFHGRTLGALSATGQEKHHEGFQPLLPGFRMVPYDDLAAAEQAVSDQTVAIMVEPIQGEGGVVVPRTPRYLEGLRELCDKRGLLLILDEIQVGVGRTGSFFAFEQSGIEPDIVTLAKALGNGFPIGATLATPEVADCMTPGSHGSTFGGNPVSCAAALAVLDELEDGAVMKNAAEVGAYLLSQLRQIAAESGRIREVRGAGMIIGAELDGEARPLVKACLDEGVIVNATAGNVLRLLPPLTLTRAQADEGLAVIRRVLKARGETT